MAKTIVALYDDFDSAQAVLRDLLDAGFSRENVSLMASDSSGEYARRYTGDQVDQVSEDVTAGEGAGFGAVVGGLIGLGVALIPGIGPVLGAGPLAAALSAGIGAAAGAITGGITAGLIDMGVDEDDANYYAEGLRRGGTLVTVTADEAWQDRVEEIMNRHHPVDVEHRAAYWRETGWTAFSAESTPYTGDDLMREREGYRDYSSRFESSGRGSTSPGDLYTDADRRRSYSPTETGYDNMQQVEEARRAERETSSTPGTRVYDRDAR